MANEIDSECSDASRRSSRLEQYKGVTWKNNQETRRHLLLQEQKRRREDSFDYLRDYGEIFTNDDREVEDGDVAEDGDFMDYTTEERGEKTSEFPRMKDLFMFSEWMKELPMDFDANWVFMLCPMGKRCLVRSCKGSTTAYGRRGNRLFRFHSLLPNGGRYSSDGSKYSKSDLTVLDCIWSSSVKKYFILDVLYWKDRSYLDTDVTFRNFWIKSKMDEIPGASEKSSRNPFPFVPLDYHPCDLVTLSGVMSRYPHFDSGEPKVDGVLFYHKEGYYAPGMTPLVLWLKPYMLPEMLGCDICVSQEYFNARPANYANMFDYMATYDGNRKRNFKKRRSKKGKVVVDEEMEEEEECLAEAVEMDE